MKRLSVSATTVVAIVVVATMSWNGTRESPLDWSLDQVGATIRMIERTVEIADASNRAEGPLAGLVRVAADSPEKARGQAIKRLYAVSDRLETLHRPEERVVRAHLAFLLFDAGRSREANRELAILRKMPETSRFCDALAAIDPNAGDDTRAAVDPQAATLLRAGWSATRMRIRLLDVAGRQTEAAPLREMVERSSHERFLRMVAVEALGALLFYVGTLSVVFEIRYAAWRPRIEPISTRSPWPFDQGIGVFVRSELLALMLAAIAAYQCRGPLSGLCLWDALLCFLPLAWLARRYLMRGSSRDALRDFRLLPAGLSGREVLRTALGLLALVWVGSIVITPISSWLGADPDLSGVYFDPMVMDTPLRVFLAAVNAVVWAPFAEEVTFRGLLYPTLRTIARPAVAGAASAALFAQAHFYSPAEALPVVWSGLVFAFGFERYRSLLPGLVCHALMNLFFIVSNIVAYR